MKKTFLTIALLAANSLLAFDSISGVDYKDTSKCNELVGIFTASYDLKAHKAYNKYKKECLLHPSNIKPNFKRDCFSLSGAWIGDGSKFCEEHPDRPQWTFNVKK